MKLKKLAALTLAGAMALSLAACGGGSSSSGAASSGAASSGAASTGDASAAGEVYKIGVLAPEVTHGWSAGVAYYAEKRCEELANEGKIEYKVSVSGDAAEMTTQLDELKTWGADAIVAFPQWEGMEVPQVFNSSNWVVISAASPLIKIFFSILPSATSSSQRFSA